MKSGLLCYYKYYFLEHPTDIFCSFTSRVSWLELDFLIYKDLRKKFKTHSSHLLLFWEFFGWFPLIVGLLGALLLKCRVKVSATIQFLDLVPNCFLGIPPTRLFFVQRLLIFGKDSLTLEEGLLLLMFSHLESIVFCPTAGIHKTNSLI